MLQQWFNPRTLLSTDTLQQIYGDQLASDASLYKSKQVLAHNLSLERYIDIPADLQNLYQTLGRPTKITSAKNFSATYCNGINLFLKREDTLMSLSFKATLIMPQIFYAKKEDFDWVIIETSAGYSGLGAAISALLNQIECNIVWTKKHFETRVLHRKIAEKWGALIHCSPLTPNKNLDGDDLLTASADVYELLKNRPKGAKISGSFTDYALIYNSLIGQEAKKQMADHKTMDSLLVVCPAGGGAMAGGTMLPFLSEDTNNGNIGYVVVENEQMPKITQGKYEKVKQYKHSEHQQLLYKYENQIQIQNVDGLSSKILSPLLSHFIHNKRITASAVSHNEAENARAALANTEGIICSIETAFCLAYLIKNIKTIKDNYKSVLIPVSGSGILEL